MKGFLLAAALAASMSINFGQGTVLLANRVPEAGLDVPFFIAGTERGPGPEHSAQLLIVLSNGSLAPLLPITRFQSAGMGLDAVLDRYLVPATVSVPGLAAGSQATFIVRAWLTPRGSYEATIFERGESAPFTVTLGDAQNPATLVGLRSFDLYLVPEPSIYALGLAGGATLLAWGRRAIQSSPRKHSFGRNKKPHFVSKCGSQETGSNPEFLPISSTPRWGGVREMGCSSHQAEWPVYCVCKCPFS